MLRVLSLRGKHIGCHLIPTSTSASAAKLGNASFEQTIWLAPCHRGVASNTSDGSRDSQTSWAAYAAIASAASGLAALWVAQNIGKVGVDTSLLGLAATAHCEAERRPTFSKQEVAKHRNKKDRVWVTHGSGVYDITDFIDGHPGGSQRIMMAAGGSIDTFWSMYRQHQTKEVQAMLEQYRIGDLEGGEAEQDQGDPYAEEPERHPALVVRSDKPFNAETPRVLLGEQQNTPNNLFYVRHHLPVPHVTAEEYRLQIEGEGVRAVTLTLDDLKTKFKHHTVAATLQCTGNRRHELKMIKNMAGLDWDIGAIGNAEWTGVLLKDVLQYAGFDPEKSPDIQHIQFEGYDNDGAGTMYGASIPILRANNKHYDVILAFEMNGEPLPADHGYPVRLVTPGITGARAVKWLKKVIPSRRESQVLWQQRDYKSFNPGVGPDDVDWSSAPAIQDTPVQSAITDPPSGAIVEDGEEDLTVRGYAWSGGGNGIVRVDVTLDGGATWTSADLQQHDRPQKRGSAWAWTLWEASLPLKDADRSKPLEVAVRAIDGSYNTQPEDCAPIWNVRGVLNNSWHRVQLRWGSPVDEGEDEDSEGIYSSTQ